ncbi:hypothetical protein [Streptomyces sp. NPDC001927]
MNPQSKQDAPDAAEGGGRRAAGGGAIATRFGKLADRCRVGVVLASLILWRREPAR